MEAIPATRYVQTDDGISLAYRITGDGPRDVVWIAGLGYPSDLVADESGFVHLARRLGAFSRVFWYEARGFGASGGSFLDNDPDIVVRDLDVMVDSVLSDQVVLVGWGHSGSAAIRYAVARPERTAGLVLIDSYAHYFAVRTTRLAPPKKSWKIGSHWQRTSGAQDFF